MHIHNISLHRQNRQDFRSPQNKHVVQPSFQSTIHLMASNGLAERIAGKTLSPFASSKAVFSRIGEEMSSHLGGIMAKPPKNEFISVMNRYMLSSIGDINKLVEKEIVSTLKTILNISHIEAKKMYQQSSKTFMDSFQQMADYSKQFVLNNSKYLNDFKAIHEELYSKLGDDAVTQVYSVVNRAATQNNISSQEIMKIDEMIPADINDKYKAVGLRLFNDLKNDPKAANLLTKFFTEMDQWLMTIVSNR